MTEQVTITEKILDTADAKSNIYEKLRMLNIRENIDEIIFNIEESKANIYLQKMLKIIGVLSSRYSNDNWSKKVALNFANCYLIDDDVDLLLELINKIGCASQITCLNFEGNAFSDDFITKLIQPLSTASKLPDLNLKGTQITVNGIETLANIDDPNNQEITIDVNNKLKEYIIFNKVRLHLKSLSLTNENKFFSISYENFIKNIAFSGRNDAICLSIDNINEDDKLDQLDKFIAENPMGSEFCIRSSTLTANQLVALYQSFFKNDQITTFQVNDDVNISKILVQTVNNDNQADTVMSDNEENTEDNNSDLNEAHNCQKANLETIIKNLTGQKLTLERHSTAIKLILSNNGKTFIFFFSMDIIEVAAIVINNNNAIDYLDLSHTNLNTENLYEIFAKVDFKNLHKAVTLDFSKNTISFENRANILAQYISQVAHPVTLKFTDNPVDKENLKIFYQILLKSASLESRTIAPRDGIFSFVFKSNRVQNACITLEFKNEINVVTTLIACSDRIHTFHCSNFTDSLLTNLIDDGLKANKSITTLKLTDSQLTNQGIAKLVELIKSNQTALAHLDLSYADKNNKDKLNSVSLNSLILALVNNTRLISLNLCCCAIDDTLVMNIENLVKNNKTLTHLDLYDTYIQYVDATIGMASIVNTLVPRTPPTRNLLCLNFNFKIDSNWSKTRENAVYKLKNKLDKYISDNINEKNNFFTYVADNNQVKVEELLKKVSMYATDNDGNYPLHIAIENGYLSLVQYFLSRGYNLYLTNKNDKTALELAQEKANSSNGDKNFIDIKNAIEKKLALPLRQQNSSSRKKTLSKKRSGPVENEANNERPIKKHKDNTGASASVANQANSDVSQESDNEAEDKVSHLDKRFFSSAISPTINNSLFDYVATGNCYQLNRYITEDNVDSLNEDNRTFLYVAAQQGQLAIVKLLLEHGADSNIPTSGEKPLTAIIERILIQRDNNRDALLIASLLVRQGTKIARTELLHRVVQAGHYRLMKILLSALDCNVNKLNEKSTVNEISGLTALELAVDRQDRLIVERLAIDRRLTASTLQNALDRATNLPRTSTTEAIVQFLTKRIEQGVPKAKPGIQWIQQTYTFFGAQSSKPKRQVHINSQKALAYLAMKNPHVKNQLANSSENVDIIGNPVTASLVFIVSTKPYRSQQVEERTKIRIMLDFKDEHHLAKSNVNHNLQEEFEKILHRAESAPSSIFEEETFEQRNKKARSPDNIKENYSLYIEGKDNLKEFDYNQTFHHGEQSLFDNIENSEMIDSIVKKLTEHPKFIQGCKIYAVVLELYSPRYPCVNCEAAILGEQNSDKSTFLQGLASKFQEYRCAIPQLSPLRMVTVVSSHRPSCDSKVLTKDDHRVLTLDIRSVHHNDVILARDESSFKEDYEMTYYHSTAPKK